MKEKSPLKEFFFSEVFKNLRKPLFTTQIEFVEFAKTLGQTVWGDKQRGDYAKVMLNQQLNYKTAIKNHYNDFKLIVRKRLEEMKVEKTDIKSIISRFDDRFQAHLILYENVKKWNGGEIESMDIEIKYLDRVRITAQSLDKESITLKEFLVWIQNMQRLD